MIQDLSRSWCVKGTDESMTRVGSSILLMHHDPDRAWITVPDPDHPKECTQNSVLTDFELSKADTTEPLIF